MRIAHDNPDTLAIFTKPSWLVMFVGALMLVMACVLALVPAKATTLQCSRGGTLASCEVVESRLLWERRITRLPEKLLRGAEAQPLKLGATVGYYRLNLQIADGEGPYYFAWYGDKRKVEEHVTSINAYLASPTVRDLRIVNDKRPPYYAIAGLLAAFGMVFVIWGSQRLHVTFSRQQRDVRILQSGLLGTRLQRFDFAEIKEVDVAGLGGDCQLYVVLASGQRFDLSTSTDTEGLVGPRRVRESRLKDAERLREFCQLA